MDPPGLEKFLNSFLSSGSTVEEWTLPQDWKKFENHFWVQEKSCGMDPLTWLEKFVLHLVEMCETQLLDVLSNDACKLWFLFLYDFSEISLNIKCAWHNADKHSRYYKTQVHIFYAIIQIIIVILIIIIMLLIWVKDPYVWLYSVSIMFLPSTELNSLIVNLP